MKAKTVPSYLGKLMATAFHQQHHIHLLDCPSDNRAATMGEKGEKQHLKRHLFITMASTANSPTLHHSQELLVPSTPHPPEA